MILKDEFIIYLESIKKYSDNTIVNYELDLDKFEDYLKIKRKNIKETKKWTTRYYSCNRCTSKRDRCRRPRASY